MTVHIPGISTPGLMDVYSVNNTAPCVSFQIFGPPPMKLHLGCKNFLFLGRYRFFNNDRSNIKKDSLVATANKRQSLHGRFAFGSSSRRCSSSGTSAHLAYSQELDKRRRRCLPQEISKKILTCNSLVRKFNVL